MALEAAALVDHFIGRIMSIRCVSHHDPEAFFEDRSEVVAEMRAKVRELRTVEKPTPRPAPIQAGVRTIRGRDVRVEVRKRRFSA